MGARQDRGMPTLPPGYSVRRPTLDDGPNVFAVVAAQNIDAIGAADYTEQDASDELDEPTFDRDRDGWLVLTEAGEPAGWAWAVIKTGSDNTEMQVYALPGHDELYGWLWETAEERAREKAREAGYSTTRLDINMYPQEKRTRRTAEAKGYQAAARFVRMRIDHPQLVPPPSLPEGTTLRHGTSEEKVRRDALDVRNKAFHDHYGFVPKDYDEWVQEREGSAAHDWSLVHVLYDGEEPAAVLVRTNHFVPDENLGYVLTLGTVPGNQGRGLAGFLLRYAFAEDAAIGRAGTVLHVDSNPQRPALGLYTRAGMREVLVIDSWRKLLDV